MIEQLLWLLAADLVPWIPARGSVGASGDLAPLAHLALVLCGEGQLLGRDGEAVPAGPALAHGDREALVLEAKEGLALINGTQLMTSLGLLAVHRSRNLVAHALVAAALSLEALEGSVAPFAADYHALRPHPLPADPREPEDTLVFPVFVAQRPVHGLTVDIVLRH